MRKQELAAWAAQVDLAQSLDELKKTRRAAKSEPAYIRKKVKYLTRMRRKQLENKVVWVDAHGRKQFTRQDLHAMKKFLDAQPLKASNIMVHPDDMKDIIEWSKENKFDVTQRSGTAASSDRADDGSGCPQEARHMDSQQP
jgi:hypothetical protein